MKKIEFIWRFLLMEVLEKRRISFVQQELAKQFSLSSSTVHLSLAPLRQLGAVRVRGRGFDVIDVEKILYHWANHRRVSRQIAFELRVRLPISEIEGLLPEGTIPTAYTAVRDRFGEPPADYDKVYCYHPNPQLIRDRFAQHGTNRPVNLIVLSADPFLGNQVSLAQLFVDLWGLSDWYAKDFVGVVKEKIDGLLS